MCRMEGFYGKKGAINNKKRKDYFGAETSFLRETWEGFYHADCLCFSMGDGKGACDRLPYWCKIPGWLIKIMFLGQVETAIR